MINVVFIRDFGPDSKNRLYQRQVNGLKVRLQGWVLALFPDREFVAGRYAVFDQRKGGEIQQPLRLGDRHGFVRRLPGFYAAGKRMRQKSMSLMTTQTLDGRVHELDTRLRP